MDQPIMKSSMGGAQGGENLRGPLLLAVIVLVVAIGSLVIWYKHTGGGASGAKFTNENVQVSKVDFNKEQGTDKLPATFPKEFPVELSNIIESTTLKYADRGVILYSVSYDSARQPEELYGVYGNFFKQNGYKVVSSAKSAGQYVYQVSKGSDTASVIITPQAAGVMVQIGYTQKV